MATPSPFHCACGSSFRMYPSPESGVPRLLRFRRRRNPVLAAVHFSFGLARPRSRLPTGVASSGVSRPARTSRLPRFGSPSVLPRFLPVRCRLRLLPSRKYLLLPRPRFLCFLRRRLLWLLPVWARLGVSQISPGRPLLPLLLWPRSLCFLQRRLLSLLPVWARLGVSQISPGRLPPPSNRLRFPSSDRPRPLSLFPVWACLGMSQFPPEFHLPLLRCLPLPLRRLPVGLDSLGCTGSPIPFPRLISMVVILRPTSRSTEVLACSLTAWSGLASTPSLSQLPCLSLLRSRAPLVPIVSSTTGPILVPIRSP